MQLKFTPGPWYIHPGSPSVVRESVNDCIVADYCDAQDARLIAAAPELLEVAQMAASSIAVDPVALMQAARAALKKAGAK